MASRITSAASTADEYYYNQTVTPTDAATHTGQLERDADEYFPLQPKKNSVPIPWDWAWD